MKKGTFPGTPVTVDVRTGASLAEEPRVRTCRHIWYSVLEVLSMRSWSAVGAALMVSVFVGVTAPAYAVVIPYNDVVIGPTTVLSGPQNAFTYTHDISPPFNPATDTILGGTLDIVVS